MNKIISILLIGCLIVGCGKDPVPVPPVPDDNSYILLQYDNYVVYADEKEVGVAVSANTDYNVNIPDGAQSWVSFQGKGTGNKFAFLKLTDNTTGVTRSAKIAFASVSGTSSDTLTITQDGKVISDYYHQWGLVGKAITSKSNDRSYEWYFNQGETGSYSSVNCGPASTTMSVKWSKMYFDKGVSDARKAYRPTGGWWYTSDIINYLNDNGVTNRTIALSDMDVIMNQIDNGNIVIMCLDMNLVSRGSDYLQRVGKFYDTSPEWGHFIVVKGYVRTEKFDYLQTYDPYSFNKKYADGTPVGRNRYYDAGELYSSASGWWKYVIVIGDTGVSGTSATKSQQVDIYSIPHNKGR